MCSKNTNHYLLKIPIINDNNLLNELKSKISIKASNVIRRTTCISSHVTTKIAMFKLIKVSTETLE